MTRPFDLRGPLPSGTTVLEASAGTGKTYTIAALVARYVAEGVASLEQLLVITFSRAASQELRERVRAQLAAVERALRTDAASDDDFLAWLLQEAGEQRPTWHRRVVDALATFDAATIATTHQFCQLVLRSLGVAGDTDSHTTLVEDPDDLVAEVVGDLYLATFGRRAEPPPFDHDTALRISRAAIGDPAATLGPVEAPAGSRPGERVAFAEAVRAEVERRKRRRGLLTYDDLLTRLRDALAGDDSPAAVRMRARWRIVLVDEFQDTDDVQWSVLERAFHGHATMVLIGDPKQAVYAFRGGDIVTYLRACAKAEQTYTLDTNWRSDAPLVEALQVLTGGAALGDPAIRVHPVHASHQGSRLHAAPRPQPLRLRAVSTDLGTTRSGTIPKDRLVAHIAADLADDVATLLASGATYAGPDGPRPVQAGDVAILMSSLREAPVFQARLLERGIPSVVSGGSSVLRTPAGDEWLTLLEALEQPQRAGRVRALALTSFVGLDAESLDAGGDDVTDDLAERVRGWLDLFRLRGVAAVHEAFTSAGLAARVLARPAGERHLTDLNHLAEVLHEVAHRERMGLAALLEWLRAEREVAQKSSERIRRLDTDAKAVQLLTIHGSKGLQYPIVHLPLVFDRWQGFDKEHLFHDAEGLRMLDVGGAPQPPPEALQLRAGEELRLTYVALTRAQSQLVTWWAPSYNAGHSGLTRLLFARAPGQAEVPSTASFPLGDAEVRELLLRWQDAGALCLEESTIAESPVRVPSTPAPVLACRRFDRGVDTTWRRTSYSGLIRAGTAALAPGVGSEPEVSGILDEADEQVPVESPGGRGPDEGDLPSPMSDLPSGATFGSLVHAVLEHADVTALDLREELQRHVTEQLRWWSVDAPAEVIAEALVPMQLTPLGPLADGLTLADLGPRDRLCELDFEFPMSGGQEASREPVPLGSLAAALRRHLPEGDPVRSYADHLTGPLGAQLLRGYLSGSIDVVLRVGSPARFLVVDYKTNRLGTPGEPLTARDYTPTAMAESMLHSHYPLQALLYSVVLHRYLRWRLSDYDPEQHLGGVLYLYLRGMCGPETPTVAGTPCGVFSWRPPAALVVELSDLLDGRVWEVAR